ncbi:MAG: hypothetical protein HKN43_14030 [Rhodothermales bacterium]|nr:hypothetical protein [Rhodothermales bacterium]
MSGDDATVKSIAQITDASGDAGSGSGGSGSASSGACQYEIVLVAYSEW